MSMSAADAAPRGRGRDVVDRRRRGDQDFSTRGRRLPVLEGISFEVREGEVVALLGKSGSGKSTLLRCIAGLLSPSSGTSSSETPARRHESWDGDGVPELRPAPG